MRATSTESTSPRRSSDDPTRTLIDDYLAEQQRLQTPVQRFSDAHDQHTLAATEPVWRDLIPLSAPRAGEQYAFEVNLDQCTGCKACVAGCHSLNGLEHEETWRDVGLVLGGTRSHPFQQTVTSACHHCEDPACLNGCPVLAYEKDPITGIVRHLDDQCIGCQYCVLKCPYDVPKYSERLGIVRKCDMCHSRLSVGEAPACVQACPTQAIRIVTVQTGAVAASVSAKPAYFPPVETSHEYTQPTTRYITAKKLPDNIAAADAVTLRPQPPHWPLVFMLTLMPMAVGAFTLDAFAPEKNAMLPTLGMVAAALGLAGSVFHLGQPLRAWRVFLGLRRSWLSREAVIFGGWFGLAGVATLLRWNPTGLISTQLITAATPWATWTTAALGGIGLFCSVMIYVDTRRPFWRFAQTAPRFFGTAAVLGSAAGFALYSDVRYAFVFGVATLFKLAVETRCLRPLDQEDEAPTPARQTALLLSDALRGATALRYLTGFALVAMSVVMLVALPSPVARWSLLGLALLSEGTERYLFFRAVFAPKMPGVGSR